MVIKIGSADDFETFFITFLTHGGTLSIQKFAYAKGLGNSRATCFIKRQ